MREPVESMKDRILTVLEKAGRNRRQLNRKLNQFEADLKTETGEKKAKWTEEYYLYLLEIYRLALEPAIEEAVNLEEYEWADCLAKRRESVEKTIEELAKEPA